MQANPSVTQRSVGEARTFKMRARSRWREAEPIPVGGELPFARSERVHLERLRELIDIELHPYRGLVRCPFHDVARRRDTTRRDVADESLDIVERFECLAERPARHTI